MDGQDPYGIVVQFRKDGLCHPTAVLGLLQGPVHECPYRAAVGLGEGPGPVGQEPGTAPGLSRPGCGGGQLQDPTVHDQPLEDGAGALMVTGPVDLAQPGQPGGDRVPRGDGRRCVGLVVPGAAVVDAPASQVVVATPHVGGAECMHDGQVVGGVVDGAQHHQQVTDLGGAEEQRAGLCPVGDGGVVQRILQVRQRGARGDQHGDVGEPACPFRAVAVLDRPPVRDSCRDRRRHVGGFKDSEVTGAELAVGSAAQEGHRRADGGGRTMAFQWDVTRLPLTCLDEASEDGVDPVEHADRGTEVPGKGDGVRRQGAAGPEVEGDVGPTEAVDGLLRITHHEDGSAGGGHLVQR